jgi:hypothetical protein
MLASNPILGMTPVRMIFHIAKNERTEGLIVIRLATWGISLKITIDHSKICVVFLVAKSFPLLKFGKHLQKSF